MLLLLHYRDISTTLKQFKNEPDTFRVPQRIKVALNHNFRDMYD